MRGSSWTPGSEWQRERRTAALTLGPAAGIEVLAEAMNTPFVPAQFDRMDSEFRQRLLQAFEQAYDFDTPMWRPVREWLDAVVARAPATLAPALRYGVAERRLHLGDIAGCEVALPGMTGPGLPLLRAAQRAWAGRQRPVTVYRLVTAGSVEEGVVELHRDKRSLADGILEGRDNAAPIGAAELRDLLRAD